MAQFQNLQELEHYIRVTLPEARAIQKLKRNDGADFVDFHWHRRHFAIRPSLEVFEIKDERGLFITGASRLVQASLLVKDRQKKVLGAVVDTLEKAEETVRSNREQALALVASCKATLGKLIIK